MSYHPIIVHDAIIIIIGDERRMNQKTEYWYCIRWEGGLIYVLDNSIQTSIMRSYEHACLRYPVTLYKKYY